MPRNHSSTSSSSASSTPNLRPDSPRRIDPCAIVGGYVPVPAATLAAVWCAFGSRTLGLADVRTWCALVHVEAGLRAAMQSGRQRKVDRPTIDQVAAAYWGGRDEAAHDRRVVRQRLNRLADLGLTRDVSSGPDETAGRQRWSTAASAPTPDVATLLTGFRCPSGRSLRLPRRWLAGFAQHLTAGTFGFAVAATFACGWGRGSGGGGNIDRPAWSGRVSAGGAAQLLGVPARTLRAARTSLLATGHLASMPDSGWAARRWGRRLMVRPGPVVNVRRRTVRVARSARRSAAQTAASARRAAASDQTQTRLRRNQTPRPTHAAGLGVCDTGVGQPEGRSRKERRPTPRRSSSRLSSCRSNPWQDADLGSTSSTGRLYRRLVEVGVLGSGPRDAVRFFAAAVRAREVSRNPVGLLRWLVTAGQWAFITDRQDEQGNREWKAWRREADVDPSATWGSEDERKPQPIAPRPRPSRQSGVPARKRLETIATTDPMKPVVRENRVLQLASESESTSSTEDTVDQWPSDVRVLVGQRAMGRARGWDDAAVDQRLSRRDGWDSARVRAAEAVARERGLLGAAGLSGCWRRGSAPAPPPGGKCSSKGRRSV